MTKREHQDGRLGLRSWRRHLGPGEPDCYRLVRVTRYRASGHRRVTGRVSLGRDFFDSPSISHIRVPSRCVRRSLLFAVQPLALHKRQRTSAVATSSVYSFPYMEL